MSKIVILDFVDGDFVNGFTVKLRIEVEGDRLWIGDAKGKLPGHPQLLELYNDWLSPYLARVAPMRSAARITRISGRIPPDPSIPTIKAASQKLKKSVDEWLSSPQMFPIQRELFHILTNKSEEIRFIFQTEVPELQLLPWHSWHIFKQPYYVKAEASLYLPVRQQTIATIGNKVRVLAVFGKKDGIGSVTRIKTEEDWKLLSKHLSEKSNAELIRLDEPTIEELCNQIEKQCPQILFFAGHSSTEGDGAIGQIELNPEESISIDDFESHLREAVEQGLQLAIFNSCEGLGIARQLAKLHIPNIIVMRESVPDDVAQKFLQRFLEAFAAGKPIHIAVRKAREKINYLENKFPGATGLAMIFQNPAAPPLLWRTLGGVEVREESKRANQAEEGFETGQASILWLPSAIGNSSNPNQQQPPTKGDDFPLPVTLNTVVGHSSVTGVISCSQGHQNPTENRFCTHCGEALKAPQTVELHSPSPSPASIVGNNQTQVSTPTGLSITTGSVLGGRYEIISILGRGGFGTTYLACDLNLPRHPKCVVKEIHLPYTFSSAWEIAKRIFFTEAEVLYKLGVHDQIPQLLSYFEENQHLYLVQELIEGEVVSEELVPGEPMSESYTIFLLRDVLEILEFVHQQNVIHRDIKPSNLIRRKQDSKLVLIDFGAVKEIGYQIGNSQEQMASCTIIGTPFYMSPEQRNGHPRVNSDIYALGIVCIQALTGLSPYQLSKNSETGEISWHSQVKVSPQLARILDKMVRYDFKERYQSATEVLLDLKHLMNPLAFKTPMSQIPMRSPRMWAQLNIKLVLLIAFLTALCLSILAFVHFAPKEPVRENPSPPKHQTSHP